MNMLTFQKDGLKWGEISNNIWGAFICAKDYLFIEVTPLDDGKYQVKYRNIEINDYERSEIKMIREKYHIGVQAEYTLAFVLGYHFGHFEWTEVCNNYKELTELFENQTSFDVAFLGDVDSAGVPNINDNIFGILIEGY